MKTSKSLLIEIPRDISCSYLNKILICKKDSCEISKVLDSPQIEIEIKDNQISLNCKKANKLQYKIIKSYEAHIKNLFQGLQEKFVYRLEAVNVHFPMSLKIDGNKLVILNFFGEKKPRYAKIFPGVDVELNGQKITVSSHNKEAAGQTAANFEKATKIRKRDKRIFQDGIYITEKPRRIFDVK